MIIKPKKNCKVCSSTGHIMSWDSKRQGTFHRGDQLSKTPCMCLIKQFRKLGTPTQPQFKDLDGQLVINFEEIVEEKVDISEKDSMLSEGDLND